MEQVSSDSPELNQIEQAVRDYILPILPNEADRYDNLTESEIERAKSILAQEYVEHGRVRDPSLLLFLILIYDYFFILEPVIYGMVVSIYGGLLGVTLDVHTPASLADETLGAHNRKEKEIRSEAKESVQINIIAVSLAVGFSAQILATIGVFGPELLDNNMFVGEYPSWVGGLSVFLIFWFYQQIPIILNHLRERI